MGVVIAIDAGTTGVRALAIAEDGHVIASRYVELAQHFPRPGWVEHDPDEIWQAVETTVAGVISDETVAAVAAVGITNQRETAVLWDRRSGQPLYRAIVWQDRRTAEACRQFAEQGYLDLVRSRTGLVLDPYFSATKVAWMLSDGGVVADANTAFGTVDSWVLWKLTGGAVHGTDSSNASRTLLFDTGELRWDPELADLFTVPMGMLPEVLPTSGVAGLTADVVNGLPPGIPIAGIAGDQQSALFGQACLDAGMAKNTYGTGSFVLMNVGGHRPPATDGLLSTVAWSLREVEPASTTYALEGSVFVTGAALQWLRDGLGIISSAAEAGPLAESVADAGGVCFVPALTGLGSPWWDPEARGTILGLSRGIRRPHLVRAAVEAMAYQSADVVEAMTEATGIRPGELRVDGGAATLDLLLRLQADLLGVPVRRSATTETTALGAAFLAGLATGVWSSTAEVTTAWRSDADVEPDQETELARAGYVAWKRAVARTLS